MTIEETKNKIVEYIQILEPNSEENEALLFDVEELIDRILIYTNRAEIPVKLNKVIAKSIVKEKQKEKEGFVGDIASITDNGQHISFKAQVMNETIFNDLKIILDKYVKATVVGEERNEFINRKIK